MGGAPGGGQKIPEVPSINGQNMFTRENQARMIKDFELFIFNRGFASIGKPRPGIRLARTTGEGGRA
jgi:hypothetical protein